LILIGGIGKLRRAEVGGDPPFLIGLEARNSINESHLGCIMNRKAIRPLVAIRN